MGKNSYYFQHDYMARNDQKILMLRSKFGWKGYGLFWALLESMAENGGYIDRNFLTGLAIGYSIDFVELESVLNYCIEIKLFNEQGQKICSDRLNEHLGIRKLLSDKGLEGAKKRWGIDGGANGQPNSDPNAKKERKKRKEKKVFTPPLIEDVISYFKEKGYAEKSARTAFEYYQTANWIDSNGKPVLNWKQKMIAVWFKPENEIKKEVNLDEIIK